MVYEICNNTYNQVRVLQVVFRTLELIRVIKGNLQFFSNQPSALSKLWIFLPDDVRPKPRVVGFRLTVMYGTSGKYSALKVLATRDWGLWLILQNCFASMAWFTRLNFLSPIPPSLLRVYNTQRRIQSNPRVPRRNGYFSSNGYKSVFKSLKETVPFLFKTNAALRFGLVTKRCRIFVSTSSV